MINPLVPLKSLYFLMFITLLLGVSCSPRERLVLPTDPDEAFNLSLWRLIENKRKLEGRKVFVSGYLVSIEPGYGIELFGSKEDSESSDILFRLNSSVRVRINSEYIADRYSTNSPFNCINKQVALVGDVGVIQAYQDIGIYKLKSIIAFDENGRRLNDKPCYVAPSYSASFLEVKIAQTLLSTLGYQAGVANGYIQEETREAVKAFQLDQGEPQTGRIDDRLLLELSQAVAER